MISHVPTLVYFCAVHKMVAPSLPCITPWQRSWELLFYSETCLPSSYGLFFHTSPPINCPTNTGKVCTMMRALCSYNPLGASATSGRAGNEPSRARLGEARCMSEPSLARLGSLASSLRRLGSARSRLASLAQNIYYAVSI